jgi:N-carbamoylputrescine amidase
MRKVTVAATQMSCSKDIKENIKKAEVLVRQASSAGANIILLPELFESLYFCQKEKCEYYSLALPLNENKAIKHFKSIAKELNIVIPISFYECVNNVRFNSIAIIDADGEILGIYRKTHIPDGPGYEEKFYFSPGDSGFKVWNTKHGKIGIGICWDQWFPETARCLTLMGAELIFYPTAIGSEPVQSNDCGIDSKDHWQRCMIGHSAANIIPVIASNRVGTESDEDSSIIFYGSSFITDQTGKVLKEMNRIEEGFIIETFDLDFCNSYRDSWGVFRDRRPEHYKQILTLDGKVI